MNQTINMFRFRFRDRSVIESFGIYGDNDDFVALKIQFEDKEESLSKTLRFVSFKTFLRPVSVTDFLSSQMTEAEKM